MPQVTEPKCNSREESARAEPGTQSAETASGALGLLEATQKAQVCNSGLCAQTQGKKVHLDGALKPSRAGTSQEELSHVSLSTSVFDNRHTDITPKHACISS